MHPCQDASFFQNGVVDCRKEGGVTKYVAKIKMTFLPQKHLLICIYSYLYYYYLLKKDGTLNKYLLLGDKLLISNIGCG